MREEDTKRIISFAQDCVLCLVSSQKLQQQFVVEEVWFIAVLLRADVYI